MEIAPQKFCFGRWQLDLQRRTLCADGTPVDLRGRGFDLLALLVEHAGEPVTREAIFAKVWPNLTVGESNLTVQISNLRKVLGENADDSGLIVTVPGRGYKFAGEVTALPAAAISKSLADTAELPPPVITAPQPAPAARRKRWGMTATAVAVILILVLGGAALMWRAPPTAPRLSIAVLPFRNLSPDHTQDYLVDALTDDLTTDLAHIPGSSVIARESADVYRGQAVIAQKIGRALHVRYLIDGSLHVEDGQYSVNVQLVDASTGQHLWASRLPPVQGKLSEVRDAIVRRIATALGFQLDQIESARSMNDRPDDPDALDLFLRARAILDWDMSLSGLTRAQRLLEQAIAQQPNFGDALADLGAMLLAKVHDMDDPTEDEDYAEAREMTGRALAVAPRNARALAAHARLLTFTGQWTEASASAAEALAIEPSSAEAEAVLAKCAQAQGRLDEAVVHIEAILRLMPNSNLTKTRYVTLGLIHLVKGQIEEGLTTLHQAIAGDEDVAPTEAMGRLEVTSLLLIAATEMLGKHDEAVALYKSYKVKWHNRTAWRFSVLFDRSYDRMQGFRRIIAALESAGMPAAADEHAPSVDQYPLCQGTFYDDTPTHLPGGEVLDTTKLLAKMEMVPRPVILDVGRGITFPKGSLLYDPVHLPETPDSFVIRMAQRVVSPSDARLIIVMGEGTYGCTAYAAAAMLIAKGYKNIAWYRGGEEAWATSGHPNSDRTSG